MRISDNTINTSMYVPSADDNKTIGIINTEDFNYADVFIASAHVGLQHRKGSINVDYMYITNVINDALSCWKGSIYIRRLIVQHLYDSVYSDYNHPDVMQVFSMDPISYKRHTKNVSNIIIPEAHIEVEGKDKNIFMFTGTSKYVNINLFQEQLSVNVIGNPLRSGLLLNSTNFTSGKFGSIIAPMDAYLTSNLGIRISGVKQGSPESYDNEIHCSDSFILELSNQVAKNTRVFRYSDDMTQVDRLNHYTQVSKFYVK